MGNQSKRMLWGIAGAVIATFGAILVKPTSTMQVIGMIGFAVGLVIVNWAVIWFDSHNDN